MGKEATAEHEKIMAEPLRSLFDALWQEVAWLYREWHEYVALFGTKPSRVELLNKAAPFFFHIVQDSLRETIFMHITCLTDLPTSNSKRGSNNKSRLTILAMKSLISDQQLKKEISILTGSAVKASNFCRDWRNRHDAHLDLDLALSKNAKPLEPASREKVKNAIESIAAVLNAISSHYIDTQMFFDTPDFPGGATGLLYVLDDGLKMDTEKRDRLQRGEGRPDDFVAPDL